MAMPNGSAAIYPALIRRLLDVGWGCEAPDSNVQTFPGRSPISPLARMARHVVSFAGPCLKKV